MSKRILLSTAATLICLLMAIVQVAGVQCSSDHGLEKQDSSFLKDGSPKCCPLHEGDDGFHLWSDDGMPHHHGECRDSQVLGDGFIFRHRLEGKKKNSLPPFENLQNPQVFHTMGKVLGLVKENDTTIVQCTGQVRDSSIELERRHGRSVRLLI
jgi:hypothetical protein